MAYAIEWSADCNGDGIVDDGQILDRTSEDVDSDGVVSTVDLLAIIGGWGTSNPILDINGSGTVDIEDMLVVLNAWGPRPLRQKSAFR